MQCSPRVFFAMVAIGSAIVRCPGACAAATNAAADDSEQPVVVVEGSRIKLERQVRQYVVSATRNTRDESPALWHQDVCPLVAGLTQEQGEFVLLRVSSAARAAGAPLGPEKCRVNLFVVFAADRQALFTAWRARQPQMFGGASGAVVRRFVECGQPICAWYNVARVGADTKKPDSVRMSWLHNTQDLLSSAGRMPNSRLETATILALDSVIVAVDPQRLNGSPLGAVADYVAMLGLAQLRTQGLDPAADTILNLFTSSGSTPAQSLTPWDHSLLRALYATQQDYVLQRSQVTQHILADLDSAGAGPSGAGP